MEEWVNFGVVSLLPWSLDDDVHKRLLVPNVVWSNGNLFIPWSRITMIPECAGNCFILSVWSVPCGFYSSILYGGFLRSQMVSFEKVVSIHIYAVMVSFGGFCLLFNVDAQTKIAYAMHPMCFAQFRENIFTGTIIQWDERGNVFLTKLNPKG